METGILQQKIINFYKNKNIKKFILISSAAVIGGKKIKPISLYGKQNC